MQNPVLDANFTLYNILNTVGYGVIILALISTNIRIAKTEKNPCKGAMAARLFVILALSLLIVNTWISLPTT